MKHIWLFFFKTFMGANSSSVVKRPILPSSVSKEQQIMCYFTCMFHTRSSGSTTDDNSLRESRIWHMVTYQQRGHGLNIHWQVANVTADYSSHMLALNNFTELQSEKEDTHYAVNEQHSQLVRF